MKLPDAFCGTLNDSKKGLFLLIVQLGKKCEAIQKAVEKGNLTDLKTALAEGHEVARKLETFFTNVEAKAGNLTTDEGGGIIDLSVPPEQRK